MPLGNAQPSCRGRHRNTQNLEPSGVFLSCMETHRAAWRCFRGRSPSVGGRTDLRRPRRRALGFPILIKRTTAYPPEGYWSVAYNLIWGKVSIAFFEAPSNKLCELD